MATVLLVGHGLIGSKLREAFVEQKDFVIILDVQKPDLSHLSDFEKSCVEFISMDINSTPSIVAVIDTLQKRGVKADSLINTSYPRSPSYGRKLDEVTLESFNQNVSLHLGGYFNVLKHFAEYFKNIGGGSVISFSSVYGVIAPRFDIYQDTSFSMPIEYAAVKSALLHLNGYFAKYYKGTNVRFNSISPGGVFGGHTEQFVKAYGKYSLSERSGMLMPEDLVSAALFLSATGARYVNGQNIIVDDGWTL